MFPGTLVKCLNKITKIKIQSYFTINIGIIDILTYFTVLEHGMMFKCIFSLSIPLRLELLANTPWTYFQTRTEVQWGWDLFFGFAELVCPAEEAAEFAFSQDQEQHSVHPDLHCSVTFLLPELPSPRALGRSQPFYYQFSLRWPNSSSSLKEIPKKGVSYCL